jgi:hypothetical protein
MEDRFLSKLNSSRRQYTGRAEEVEIAFTNDNIDCTAVFEAEIQMDNAHSLKEP